MRPRLCRIPSRDGIYFSEDPKVRAQLAGEEPSGKGPNEIEALQYLTAAGSSISPKFLDARIEKQDETMWVPGGYTIYTLMEKLPGRNVNDFYQWPREKRVARGLLGILFVSQAHKLYIHLLKTNLSFH